MKLSEYSVSVLKNFATINAGMVLKKGNRQRVLSDDDAILGEVEFEETMPQDFGVYDLHQFLGNIVALGSPELTFEDKRLTMKVDGFSTVYYGCDTSLPKHVPDGKVGMGEPDITFELSERSLSKLLKIAATNSLPNFSIVGDGSKIEIKIHEKGNPTSNYSGFDVGTYSSGPINTTFKVSNVLRIMPGDYIVGVKDGKFAKFQSKTHKLTYYILANRDKK